MFVMSNINQAYSDINSNISNISNNSNNTTRIKDSFFNSLNNCKYDLFNARQRFNCIHTRSKIMSYLPDYIPTPQFLLNINESVRCKIGLLKHLSEEELILSILLILNFGYQLYSKNIKYNITPRLLDTLIELELKKEVFELILYYINPLKKSPYYHTIKLGTSMSLISCIKQSNIDIYKLLIKNNITWESLPYYLNCEDIYDELKLIALRFPI